MFQSKWDELIATYHQEKEKSDGAVEKIKKVTFLLGSDDDKRYIAKGSYDAFIFLGEYERDYVAVKQLLKQSLQKEKDLHKEMEDRDMKNVLKILCIEEDRFFYYVVTPLCEQDLSCLIEGSEGANRLSQTQQINLCLDILNGLKSLHNLGILHRDLKPRNVLIGMMHKFCSQFHSRIVCPENMKNKITITLSHAEDLTLAPTPSKSIAFKTIDACCSLVSCDTLKSTCKKRTV